MLPIPTPEHLPAELAALDTPALRLELARSLTISAAHLMRLAAIWGELERRGEDLTELRTGLAVYLPLIASGTLDAELVVRFAGQQGILRHLAELPRAEQRRLLDGGTVPLLERLHHGDQVRQVPLRLMTLQNIKQVIQGGKIVQPAAQRASLESARPKRRNRVSPERMAAELEELGEEYPDARPLIAQLRQLTGI